MQGILLLHLYAVPFTFGPSVYHPAIVIYYESESAMIPLFRKITKGASINLKNISHVHFRMYYERANKLLENIFDFDAKQQTAALILRSLHFCAA